jgi:hypothetical protein
VKPSVPGRSLAACQRTQKLRGSRIVWLNLTGHFSPILPPFAHRGLSCSLAWSASRDERRNRSRGVGVQTASKAEVR